MTENEDGWGQFDVSPEKIKKAQEEQEAKGREIASVFHRVFVQNEDGVKLLESFKDKFVMTAIVRPDDSQFEAGIRAGRADVVHQILANIKIAEQE